MLCLCCIILSGDSLYLGVWPEVIYTRTRNKLLYSLFGITQFNSNIEVQTESITNSNELN